MSDELRLVGVAGAEPAEGWMDESEWAAEADEMRAEREEHEQEHEEMDDHDHDEDEWGDDGFGFIHFGAHADPLVDGRAHSWIYSFAAPAEGLEYDVLVAANGTILAESWDQDDEPDEHPDPAIDGWSVDSDEAFEIAADNSEEFATAMVGGSAFSGLGQDEESGDPIWGLSIWSDEGESWVAAVNARNGTFLGASNWSMPDFDFDWEWDWDWDGFGDWFAPPEKGSFDGQVTLLAPEAEHVFSIEDDTHEALFVTLQVDLVTPITAVSLQVTDPMGEVHELRIDPGTFPDGEGRATAQLHTMQPMAGDHTVSLLMEQGTSHDYWVGWCATGFEIDLDFTPDAAGRPDPCHEL